MSDDSTHAAAVLGTSRLASRLAWAVPSFHIPAVVAAGFLTPSYDSARGAISMLGSARSPFHALVNFWGLIVPGVLLTLSVLALRQARTPLVPPARGLAVVALAGFAVVGCGLISLPSAVHLAMSLPADLLAASGLFLLGPWATRAFGSRRWGLSAHAIAIILVVDAISWGLALRYGDRIHPYLGVQQRVGVFGSFIWWAAFTSRVER